MWTYLSFAISGSIVGFSIWDAVRKAPEASTNPHWLRRSWPKLVTLVLGLALLGVQAKSNAVAGVEADKRLHQALADQRDQLTGAFKAGTDQVIKSSTGEAEQTRKDASTETDAIRRQAKEQLSQVQGFMLGTTTCPAVIASIVRPRGRPNSLAIFNLDKTLNMHDLSIELTEFGPGEPGGPWSTILQQKTINLPLIIPESVRTVPFQFLSKMKDIDVQVILSTRTARCNGRFDLYDTGNDVWVNDSNEMFTKDGKLAYREGMKLSPGLAASKPDQN